jgi:hypothetical protein
MSSSISPSQAVRAEVDGRVTRIVDRWCDSDRVRSFLQADRDVIEASRPLRTLIVEELFRAPDSRDLLNAFAALGRLTSERGGSPTLAATLVDGLVSEVDRAPGAGWIPARSAVVESYVRVTTETTRENDARRWDYPACAVPLHEGIVAVAAGYRDDDDDALAGWASRVANAASLAGVRRVVLSGSPKAVAALEEALGIAGIERIASYAVGMRGKKS